MRRVATDEKIRNHALVYLRKGTRRFAYGPTVAGVLHPQLSGVLQLEDGELVIVSAFLTSVSWYAFTTRRIISQYDDRRQSLNPALGFSTDFGNFKGLDDKRQLGAIPRQVATFTSLTSGDVVRLEYQTGEASMLPIYAARYWSVRHPVIEKLNDQPKAPDWPWRSQQG